MSPAPSLFVSHGSPMFALKPGESGPKLRVLGERLRDLQAVLVVSPHWMSPSVRVMTNAAPATLHDFGGFDPALNLLRYPAPGHPELAAEAARLLREAGFSVELDPQRPFDHGAWVPLLHLLPGADVPVFQVSLPQSLDSAGALRLGQALAPLRERGVLIVGSGSLTHNLFEVFRGKNVDGAYAREFATWVRDAVQRGDIEALTDYRRRAPQAERAHPTEEHFLPLLVALGASASEDVVTPIDGGFTDGVLSMDSFLWGASA